ncbi:MAG TPA: hypothetical protein ENJ88_04495 [Phaeodactylibacter sp.]|nr:hypothetical protein [Phaeodactylibacter sp.]
MKKLLLLLCLIAAFDLTAQSSNTYPNLQYDAAIWKEVPKVVLKYLNANLPAASAVARETGMPVDLLLCAAALESGWGRSELTLRANNHFGIKNPYEDGPSYCMMHEDFIPGEGPVMSYTCFKKYASAYESFLDYVEHLQTRGCYLDINQYASPVFEDWVQVVVDCGYATDPLYGEKLLRIRKQYYFDFLIGPQWR